MSCFLARCIVSSVSRLQMAKRDLSLMQTIAREGTTMNRRAFNLRHGLAVAFCISGVQLFASGNVAAQANNYELIMLGSSGSTTGPEYHALIVDHVKNRLIRCTVTINNGSPTLSSKCDPPVQSLPSGGTNPQTLIPGAPFKDDMPSFPFTVWEIDRANGVTNFCNKGSAEAPLTCTSLVLP
jgi:hypothetical protein